MTERGVEGPSPRGNLDSYERPVEHQAPGELQTEIEVRAMHRLWRMAGIGLKAENLIKVEEAWMRGDDEGVLETVLDWGWDNDPMLQALFLDLAREDEDRAWPVYRRWYREKLQESGIDTYWWKEKVAYARDCLEEYERLGDEIKGDEYSILLAKMWRIVVEEGEAYASERGGS